LAKRLGVVDGISDGGEHRHHPSFSPGFVSRAP
jgi:hypothetical protein